MEFLADDAQSYADIANRLANDKAFKNEIKNRILKNADILSQFQNVQFCSRSRKAKILTTGIHGVFRGLKFEPVEAKRRSRSSGTQISDKKGRFEIGSSCMRI